MEGFRVFCLEVNKKNMQFKKIEIIAIDEDGKKLSLGEKMPCLPELIDEKKQIELVKKRLLAKINPKYVDIHIEFNTNDKKEAIKQYDNFINNYERKTLRWPSLERRILYKEIYDDELDDDVLEEDGWDGYIAKGFVEVEKRKIKEYKFEITEWS